MSWATDRLQERSPGLPGPCCSARSPRREHVFGPGRVPCNLVAGVETAVPGALTKPTNR